MHLDYDGGHILQETARWSRFLSIVWFIGLGLCVLVVALMGSALLMLLSRFSPELESLGSAGAAILIVTVIIFAAIFGFVAFTLYRFSTLTRKGIDHQDQATFAAGMRSLKIYFLINGIFALIGLLFQLFSLLTLF